MSISASKLLKIIPLFVLLFTCVYLALLRTFILRDQRPESDKQPTVAVGVLVTPNMDMYWDRFLEMNTGWHAEFSMLKGYTFDPIESKNDSRLIQVDKLFPTEKNGSGDQWTNIPLASFQRMGTDIDTDWYLQVDEDTVIVPVNLKRLVRALSNYPGPLMVGKCASFIDIAEGVIKFGVGGSGILMNRALMTALQPHFSTCRRRFNRMYYSDARIGACVSLVLNQSGTICPSKDWQVRAGGRLWSFTNRNARLESQHQSPDALVVSMHEKSPTRIRLLNRYVRELTERGIDITWRSLAIAMNADGY